MFSRYTLDFPFPNGYEYSEVNSDEFKRASTLTTSILAGRTNLIRLANDYYTSYSEAPIKTLLHYRDYLLSKAIILSLQSVLFNDGISDRPTSLSLKALQRSSYNQLWPRFDNQENKKYNYASFVGSLGFYHLTIDSKGSPLQSLKDLVAAVWSFVGVDPLSSSTAKLQSLIRQFRIDGDLQAKIDNVISRLYDYDNEPDTQLKDKLRRIYLYAQRNFISSRDFSNFTIRLIYGTYNDKVFNILYPLFLAFYDDRAAEALTRSVRYSHSITRPAGIYMPLQALKIEGLIRAIDSINAIDDLGVLSIPVDEVLYAEINKDLDISSQLAELLTDVAYDIAMGLAQAYRASQIQLVGEPLSYAQKDGALFHNLTIPWLKRSNKMAIEDQDILWSDNNFYGVDIGRLDVSQESNLSLDDLFVSSVYRDLQGRPSNEGSTLMLSTNEVFGPNLQLNVVSLLGTEEEVKVAFINNPEQPLVPIDTKGYINSPSSPSVLSSSASTVIANPQQSFNGYVASVAYVPTDQTRRLSNVISYEQYMSLQETTAVSNVIVTRLGQPADDLQPVIRSYINDQTDRYRTLQEMQLTSVPRGFDYQQPAVYGRVSSSTRDSDTEQYIADARLQGNRLEHTARIAGLSRQLQRTHLSSEVSLLEQFSKYADSRVGSSTNPSTSNSDNSDPSVDTPVDVPSENTPEPPLDPNYGIA